MTVTNPRTDPVPPEDDLPEAERTVPFAARASSWRDAFKVGPTARPLLIGVGILVGGFLGYLALRDEPATPIILGAGVPEQEMVAPEAPAMRAINPLEAPNMPPLTAEAERLITKDPDNRTLLYLPLSLDVWRQMSPPWAPPGVDYCSWRLYMAEGGALTATTEEGAGVALFRQDVAPCGGETEGTEGTLPPALNGNVTPPTAATASGPTR